MKKHLSKIFLPLAGLALALPNFAHAGLGDFFGIGDIAGKAIGWILFTINFVIAYILGAVLAFLASFVSILLDINKNIGTTSVVRLGLGATTSLVMFFFAFAFLYIGLRYIAGFVGPGEKGIFVRLLGALILVQFLPAPILPTLEAGPEKLSSFFMDNFAPKDPALQDIPGTALPSMAFTNALVGAFQPQAMFIMSTSTKIAGDTVETGTLGVNDSKSNGLGNIIKPLVGIFVTIVYMLVVDLIMLVLMVMLGVRYVMLTLLYIFVPFVVLAWVFPAFRHLWRNWWTSFIRWTFYPTIVLLGLYLSIMAAQYIKNNADSDTPLIPKDEISTVMKGPSDFMGTPKDADPMGGMIGIILTPIMQGIIIVGLAIGGLIAADKMSIHLSETSVTTAELAGDGIRRSMSHSGGARRVFNNIRQRTAASTRTPLRPPLAIMPSTRGGGGGPPLTPGQAQGLASLASRNAAEAKLRVATLRGQTASDSPLNSGVAGGVAATTGGATTTIDRANLTAAKADFARKNRDAILTKDELNSINRMQATVAQTETGAQSTTTARSSDKVVSIASGRGFDSSTLETTRRTTTPARKIDSINNRDGATATSIQNGSKTSILPESQPIAINASSGPVPLGQLTKKDTVNTPTTAGFPGGLNKVLPIDSREAAAPKTSVLNPNIPTTGSTPQANRATLNNTLQSTEKTTGKESLLDEVITETETGPQEISRAKLLSKTSSPAGSEIKPSSNAPTPASMSSVGLSQNRSVVASELLHKPGSQEVLLSSVTNENNSQNTQRAPGLNGDTRTQTNSQPTSTRDVVRPGATEATVQTITTKNDPQDTGLGQVAKLGVPAVDSISTTLNITTENNPTLDEIVTATQEKLPQGAPTSTTKPKPNTPENQTVTAELLGRQTQDPNSGATWKPPRIPVWQRATSRSSPTAPPTAPPLKIVSPDIRVIPEGSLAKAVEGQMIEIDRTRRAA